MKPQVWLLKLHLLLLIAAGCERQTPAPTTSDSAPSRPTLPAASTPEAGPQPLIAIGAKLLPLLQKPDEAKARPHFSDEFLKAAAPGEIRNAFERHLRAYGRPTRMVLVEVLGPHAGVFEISYARGRVPVTVNLDPEQPERIAGMFFKPLIVDADTLDDLVAELAGLPGKTSLTLDRLEPNPEPLARLHADEPLAIGSTFKLFLLAALAEEVANGRRDWSDLVQLHPAWQSLPSGYLQDWPAGSPITLHTLAALMLSRSDNTAGDHLLHTLGREAVEVALPRFGITAAARNRPLLATRELFALKLILPPATLERYAAADEAARRELLAGEVAAAALENPRLLVKPLEIEKVEWFASSADLGRLLAWLKAVPAEPARELLAILPPFPRMEEDWSYVGFKGGAECGVISYALLLRSQSGAWYTLAVTWNNPAEAVNPEQLLAWVDRVLRTLRRREQATNTGGAPHRTP